MLKLTTKQTGKFINIKIKSQIKHVLLDVFLVFNSSKYFAFLPIASFFSIFSHLFTITSICNNRIQKKFRKYFHWNRVASGARIILTSPDPSSNNALPDIEHENTIFSETDTDSVTFNAHDKETTSNDALSSVSSNSIETDESASAQTQPQKVKITIDSVAPYENDEEIQSNGVVESERDTTEHANDEISEKHVKNDEL